MRFHLFAVVIRYTNHCLYISDTDKSSTDGDYTEEDRIYDDCSDYSKIKASLGCPSYLVRTLKYQTKLTEPYIHVRYMKFRIKYPVGFIGKKAFQVRISNI